MRPRHESQPAHDPLEAELLDGAVDIIAEAIIETAPAARTGTRGRIQQVALDMFTTRGFEGTSLREIAEELGVTKAALYYHFKTKDEILESIVADRSAEIGKLIEWAEAQPRGLATRQEFLRRYSALLHEQGHHELMRLFERNQTSMTKHKAGIMMRQHMTRMLGLLSDGDAPPTEQIRSSLAVFALHSTWLTVRDPRTTDDERRQAALEIALTLIK